MKLNELCIISQKYPTKDDPVFVFVRETIAAIADQGVRCTVISPQSIIKRERPVHWLDKTECGNTIDVYQPYCLQSAAISKYIKGFNQSLRLKSIEKCVNKIYKEKKICFDAIYGHFWDSGIYAEVIGKKMGAPVFVVSGESRIRVPNFLKKIHDEHNDRLNGCICVSSKNADESVSLGLVTPELIKVIPNAINPQEFKKLDKKECRKELNIPDDYFIVSFTGAFTDRKGSVRLSSALESLDDIYSIFIGKGEKVPNCPRILFMGALPHTKICKYLNAADVFVLPTQAEGCCNAIIEAMACGLPIISSDKAFNDDILTDGNSIRIDSDSIEQIKVAIETLKDDKDRRNRMAECSLQLSKNLRLDVRAKKIISFIEERMER